MRVMQASLAEPIRSSWNPPTMSCPRSGRCRSAPAAAEAEASSPARGAGPVSGVLVRGAVTPRWHSAGRNLPPAEQLRRERQAACFLQAAVAPRDRANHCPALPPDGPAPEAFLPAAGQGSRGTEPTLAMFLRPTPEPVRVFLRYLPVSIPADHRVPDNLAAVTPPPIDPGRK